MSNSNSLITVRALRDGLTGLVNTRNGEADFFITDDVSRARVSVEIAAALVGDNLALPEGADDILALADYLSKAVITDSGPADLGEDVRLITPDLAGSKVTIKGLTVAFDASGEAVCPRVVAEQIKQSRKSTIKPLESKPAEVPISPTPNHPQKPVVTSLAPAPSEDYTPPVGNPTSIIDIQGPGFVDDFVDEQLSESEGVPKATTDDLQKQLEQLVQQQIENQDETKQSEPVETKTEESAKLETDTKVAEVPTTLPIDADREASKELVDLVMARPAKALAVAGYPTIELARQANPKTLEDINGVSDLTVAKIFN